VGRHLTTHQALTYCECPKKYYFRYVAKETPNYTQEHVRDMLSMRGWLAFLRNERKALGDVEGPKDLETAYERIMDISVATAISRTSHLLGDTEPLDAAQVVREELGRLAALRMERAERHMRLYGLNGNLLGQIAYAPEDVERRIVSFRHRTSGKVSLIKRDEGHATPIQVTSSVPPLGKADIGGEIVAKINAMLLREETGDDIPLSVVHYLRIHRTAHFSTGEGDKEVIKTFSEDVREAGTYHKREDGCPRCEFGEVCGRK